MPAKAIKKERPEHAARSCLSDLPYRAVVFVRADGNQVPLYAVAGSDQPPCGAEKALLKAHNLHGGACFYCKKKLKPADVTIDHAEARCKGGGDALQNLIISCGPCNRGKGERAIETFNPEAGREWLSALLKQVQDRLNRLDG